MKKDENYIIVRGLLHGSTPSSYRPTLVGAHGSSLPRALHLASLSGLASNGTDRPGRVWIEDFRYPATK